MTILFFLAQYNMVGTVADLCVCVCYLVYFCGALCEDGADSGGQSQLHQALQLRLSIRLHLVPRLFQGAAVYQSKTPARAQTTQE